MQDISTPGTPVRIHPHEAKAFSVVEGRAASGLVLLCDHASNALPPAYGTLGLPAAELSRHIAYDIGAAAVTRALAERLDAPAILSKFSRLLIDCNRGSDDPTLIMRISDGAIVPGNRKLDDAEREHRISSFYAPYHEAVTKVINTLLDASVTPVLLSIHSFTETWNGAQRPWHAGVLWDNDDRLSRRILAALRSEPGIVTGDNLPYSGRLKGDTLWQHGTRRGLAHAIIEIRQDLIRNSAGQKEWSERLARIMTRILAEPAAATDLHRICDCGSRTDEPDSKDAPMTKIDDKMRTELEAAAYRRLVQHLRSRTDVQNIDLMNLAGFCRNCLANWYQEAASAKGLDLTKEGAREIVYGMPYSEWQAKNQKEAGPDKVAAFEKARPKDH